MRSLLKRLLGKIRERQERQLIPSQVFGIPAQGSLAYSLMNSVKWKPEYVTMLCYSVVAIAFFLAVIAVNPAAFVLLGLFNLMALVF